MLSTFLLQQPELLAKAQVAAAAEDLRVFDGYVFEALQFKPAFPYFFRVCERDTSLARGTDYQTQMSAGQTVLAVTHSAMFDEAAFADPDQFDPDREISNAFHFGLGLHECLGRAIGAVMIPEIVRQSLLLPDLQVGPVDRKGGPVPEVLAVALENAVRLFEIGNFCCTEEERMPEKPLTEAELDALRAFDTPTICNALEVVAPERRALGFTTQTLICPFPELPPIVGYARTAMIRSALPQGLSGAEQRKARLDYYRYVAAGSGPEVVVIQDVDSRIGFGCFWGEVADRDPQRPRLSGPGHRRRGARPRCRGARVPGAVRQGHALPRLGAQHRPGGTVDVFGMVVRSDDLIHADRHGAVVIPPEVAREVAERRPALRPPRGADPERRPQPRLLPRGAGARHGRGRGDPLGRDGVRQHGVPSKS